MKRSVGLVSALILAKMMAPVGATEISNDKPIWNQVPRMFCQGIRRYDCKNMRCNLDTSTIAWLIDFETRSVKFLNQTGITIDIVGYNFAPGGFYASTQAVFLKDGRVLYFHRPLSRLDGVPATLLGTLQERTGPAWIDGADLACHPQ